MLFALLKGTSQYGALELHIDGLAAALKAVGHDTVVIDTVPDFEALISRTTGQRPDVFLSMNGIGCERQFNGGSAYDHLGAVFASIYVDSPLYHLGRLAEPARRKVAFFLDETHVDLMRTWSGGADFRSIAFLPPGAIASDQSVSASPEAFAVRDIDILFTGTYRGEPERPWLDWPNGPTRHIIDDVADRMAGAGDLPARQALVQAIQDFGAEPTQERVSNFLKALVVAQQFAEGYHRAAFVRTLGQAGTPVTVYGRGWDAVAARFPSFNDCGLGSFGETLTLLPRTRIVLNTNNGFVAGGHERVFTAMNAGAHVFSDASTFYARSFEEDREISTFSWSDLAGVPARLEALLGDRDGLAARAAAGQKRAQAEHSWASRVEDLLRALEGV